jgi:hypothetical protein
MDFSRRMGSSPCGSEQPRAKTQRPPRRAKSQSEPPSTTEATESTENGRQRAEDGRPQAATDFVLPRTGNCLLTTDF